MQNEKGMTLIEVLVALAILGIALAAAIQATAQSIRRTVDLQQKMLATWTGLDLIRRTQTGLSRAPGEGGKLQGESQMANQPWTWEITETTTPHPAIHALHVAVSHPPDNHPLARLTGYLYVPKIE